MSGYAIRVGPSARRGLLALSDANFQRVSKLVDMLRDAPRLGHVYEPTYSAARLPFECRVCYAGRYGVYYTVDDSLGEVYVRYLEDQRGDPLMRFTERLGSGETRQSD